MVRHEVIASDGKAVVFVDPLPGGGHVFGAIVMPILPEPHAPSWTAVGPWTPPDMVDILDWALMNRGLTPLSRKQRTALRDALQRELDGEFIIGRREKSRLDDTSPYEVESHVRRIGRNLYRFTRCVNTVGRTHFLSVERRTDDGAGAEYISPADVNLEGSFGWKLVRVLHGDDEPVPSTS
jgi:hypothetical protein